MATKLERNGTTGYPFNLRRFYDFIDVHNEIYEFFEAILGSDSYLLYGLEEISNNNGIIGHNTGLIFHQREYLFFDQNGLWNSNNPLSKLCVVEEVRYGNYDDGNGNLSNLPVSRFRYLRFGLENDQGVVDTIDHLNLIKLKNIQELSQFSMPDGVVVDPNYLAFTQAMLNKLNGIQAGAQVNVKPSWTAAAGSANEILNKPAVDVALWKGHVFVDDVYPNEIFTITFPTSVGTADYYVLFTYETLGTNDGTRSAAATIFHAYYDCTANGFKFRLGEKGNINQGPVRIYMEVKRK